MTDKQFNKRLLGLAFLVATEGAEDTFALEYETLLHDVKASAEPQYSKFQKMKTLLLQQAAYLMTEWLKEGGSMVITKRKEIIQ